MTNKLEIHGLDLTGMGIGDVVGGDVVVADLRDVIKMELVSILKEIGLVEIEEPVEIDVEDWCPRGDEDRPFSD